MDNNILAMHRRIQYMNMVLRDFQKIGSHWHLVLFVKNLHYKDGYKDTKHLKILHEETENLHLIKLQNHK
jgi:hypothetical protein